MNNDNESNLIAEYSIIQRSISTASKFIIQVFGFSIAVITALTIANLQLKDIYLLSVVIVVTLSSASYISWQTRLITDAETYIIVFIEPYLKNFKWKKRSFEKYKERKRNNKRPIFARSIIFSDFVAFTYIIAIAINVAILYSFSCGKFYKIAFSLVSIISIFMFLYYLSIYTQEKYYTESVNDWKVLKQKEERGNGNLEQLLLDPSPAKLLDSSGKEFPIPKSAYPFLQQVIQIMTSDTSIVSQEREVTMQEASELLNVSQSFLNKLLEEGKIPYTRVGSDKSIRFQDLILYKKQRDTTRSKLLDELIQTSQEEGFYSDSDE